MRIRRIVAASLLAIGLATAVVIVSLDSDETPAAIAAGTTITTTRVATTRPTAGAPIPTITGALAAAAIEQRPSVDLRADTFEGLREVWDQIDGFWAWLNAHPTDDPALLGVIFHPEGIEYARQAETLGDLERDELRLVAPTAIGEVIAFGCCPDPQAEMDRGSITLAIRTASETHAELSDTRGRSVATIPGFRAAQWLVTLTRDDEGRWIVWSLERS